MGSSTSKTPPPISNAAPSKRSATSSSSSSRETKTGSKLEEKSSSSTNANKGKQANSASKGEEIILTPKPTPSSLPNSQENSSLVTESRNQTLQSNTIVHRQPDDHDLNAGSAFSETTLPERAMTVEDDLSSNNRISNCNNNNNNSLEMNPGEFNGYPEEGVFSFPKTLVTLDDLTEATFDKTSQDQKIDENMSASKTTAATTSASSSSCLSSSPIHTTTIVSGIENADGEGGGGSDSSVLHDSFGSFNDSIPLEIPPEDIEIGEFLGEGVYSEVYKGYCYGTPVAVKKFKNQGLDASILKEVRKEVRIMKSIRHPNLLLFLGACTKPGCLMIVTELMEKSFHEMEDIDLLTKLKMIKEAAKGLSWLHSLNPVIIHRDLKPENILVNPERTTVKVADFGLSLVKDHSKQEAEEMKKIRGSPAFMSPEALLGQELTSKSDVYSFGMILWELVAGRSPYEDMGIESFEQLIEEICEKRTREEIPMDCAKCVTQLIEASWQPDPELRPSFLQIIVQLDQCILEVSLSDIDAQRWWWKSFCRNSTLAYEIPWDTFLLHLSAHLCLSSSLKIFQALKSFLVKNERDQVHIEDFGNVLRWFGPLNSEKMNFLVTMQNLCTKRWFHGDISQEQAETQLTGTEPGTFLIRLSSNPGCFALSSMIENHQQQKVIVHIRIAQKARKYSFVLDDNLYDFESLDELVKAPVLELKAACPGSKYYAQFRIKQLVSGYVNTVKP